MSFHVIYELFLYCNLYIIPYLGGGVSDSWLDVRKRGGGVIQMRTVCNRRGGGV